MKIGGSLLEYPEKLKLLCSNLVDLSNDFNLVIIPGGGIFAETVRDIYTRFTITEDTAHQMAVLAMNQYGLFLKNLIGDDSQIIEKVDELNNCFKNKRIAIFQVSKIIESDNYLPKLWSVTSDSIAAYITQIIRAKNLILIKVVDGLSEQGSDTLLSQVNVDKLNAGVNKGCIDEYVPTILKNNKMECFIVNGKFPNRVKDILRGDKTVSTKIIYD